MTRTPTTEPLREALEICLAELRRRERAAGKVISSPVAVFARSRLDGLATTPEIEAAARRVLRDEVSAAHDHDCTALNETLEASPLAEPWNEGERNG